MTAAFPTAAAPLGGWWLPTDAAEPILTPADIVAGDAVWIAEIGRAPRLATARAPAPLGMTAGGPVADPARPADMPETAPTLIVSDRGWVGEPSDGTRPNTIAPARLIEPPALEMSLPILPEEARRGALAAGELRLANADGALDYLAGNWTIGGRPVRLLRGAHRRPIHAAYAEMIQVANLRARGAASGTVRLTIPLADAAADLDVPACETYGGTGGADGVASLAGQPKPRLYGIRRRIEPVFEDTARLIYRLHHGGAIESVLAVRDRGAALTSNGDVANYAALQAATPASGTYTTCLADGCIRLGATPSVLTVDARGDAAGGYSAGTAASIATKLITGPGGISAVAIAPGAFGAWPVGEAGLYLTGGTVSQALDALAVRLAAWWGVTRLGQFTGGQIARPETMAPAWDVRPWMLRQPPEVIASDPPRWRARVGYAVAGRVLQGDDLAGSVSAADRELWGKPWLTAADADTAISALYPLAQDPAEMPSVFDSESDAGALALYLREMHQAPRQTWRVPLNRAGIALECGQAVRLTWPRHGLAKGRVLLVRALSLRGDRIEALLWG